MSVCDIGVSAKEISSSILSHSSRVETILDNHKSISFNSFLYYEFPLPKQDTIYLCYVLVHMSVVFKVN